MPLPACVPGTIGLLRVQAIGVSPAPHLLLATCRAECHRQGADRFHFLSFQGGAQLHRRSRRVTQDHTEGMKSYDELCALLDRRPHALARRIAAVGYGDIAWSQGAMLERFAGVAIADQHLETLQGHQVHRAMEAMVGASGSWGLHTPGVNDHKASPRRQRVHRRQRQHPSEHRVHPRPTGA